MFAKFKRLYVYINEKRKLLYRNLVPHSVQTRLLGHRGAVSSEKDWHDLGKWQFHFLVSQGLKPSDVLLDAGCGSLRLGQFVIPYLDKSNYCGFDRERFLLKNGVESELLESISDIKMLNLKCTSKFEIVEFPSFNYCIAQSLVSHLNQSDLDLFLKKIKQKAAPGSLFFFSFPESQDDDYKHPGYIGKSSNYQYFYYSRKYLEVKCSDLGWNVEYLGQPKDYFPYQSWLKCKN